MRQWVALAALVGAAALVAGLALSTSSASAPFGPSASVSVSNNSPGAAADLSVDSSVPGGHQRIRSQIVTLPLGWIVDGTQDITVGSGFVQLDRDCDGSQQSYPFTLVSEQARPVTS